MLPSDPLMLLSFINTRLRDEYDSLDALCDALDESAEDIKAALGKIDYRYNEELNQFK
ncbi:MAG: DUF4250 domain-containing protein [Clostridiales bacterium]|nr:DUF4250 domain-containing protein [Clostridiales bacterium]